MKVLVIGNGCREHALVKALQEDSKVTQVYTFPERISLKNVKNLPSLDGAEQVSQYLIDEGIELVVIGPEKYLIDAWADIFRKKEIKVFGPSQKAAQLEGSKIFSKKFMKKYQIPTASYQIVSSVSDVLKEAKNFFPPYVLKADGLAGGKGVFLCSHIQELEERARCLFEDKILGSAGKQALIEDFQSGEEISVFVITNGKDYEILPIARDYKRLFDGQEGPNTGGMGAVAPISISTELKNQIEQLIVQPSLQGLREEGSPYNGILYIGLMVDKGIPKVLEYNVRFGDPEAQVLLPLLDGSWADAFYQVASGNFVNLKWKDQHSVCVVLASRGYPDHSIKGDLIHGDINHSTSSSYILHGAVSHQQDQWVTNGGRVLNIISLSQDREIALAEAYKNLKIISWKGMQYRKDIGK